MKIENKEGQSRKVVYCGEKQGGTYTKVSFLEAESSGIPKEKGLWPERSTPYR